MDFLRYFPGKVFETVKDGVCAIASGHLQATAATANQALLTAVSGKIIILLQLSMCSRGAASDIALFSASAGTLIGVWDIPANTVATPNVILPPAPWGIVQSKVGEGLYVNCGAVSVDINYEWIAYTP